MTDRLVSVRFDDLAFALERMAFSGCMCREGSDGACVCDYSRREDRQVAQRLSDALTGTQHDG